MKTNNLYLVINSLEAGGAEALNIQLAQYIHPAAIVQLENKIEYDVTELKTKLLGLSPYLNMYGFLKYSLTWCYAIRLAHILKNDPSHEIILLASLPRSYHVAILAKKLLSKQKNIKVGIWEHANPTSYKRSFFLNKLTQSLYKECDKIFTNSKNACRVFNETYKLPKEKTAVLYNFFDFNSIWAKADAMIIPEHEKLFNHKTLLYLGRLHANKGIEFLLEVYKLLHAKDDSIHLVFVGKGELASSINNFIIENNLQSHIHVLGFTKNPFPYLKRAKALIFPSENEGFGNVIVESLILNTPVLAADIDNGPREILAPDSDFTLRTSKPDYVEGGILLPSMIHNEKKDLVINDWVETIHSFFNDIEWQKKYQAIDNRIIQQFNINHQAEILNSILSKI